MGSVYSSLTKIASQRKPIFISKIIPHARQLGGLRFLNSIAEMGIYSASHSIRDIEERDVQELVYN